MLQLKQKNAGSRPEWLVNPSYTFGMGTDNDYHVGSAAHEATLQVEGDLLTLLNVSGNDHVQVNGFPVRKQARLGADDEFSVGDAVFELHDPKALRSDKKVPGVEEAVAIGTGWSLRALNTALANKSYPLRATQTIGRANDCDICLNVVHLSRRHAQLTIKENYLQVDDLNSSNGTFVNGKKIQTAKVKAGDELMFDTLKFRVQGPFAEVEKTQTRSGGVDIDSDQTSVRHAVVLGEKPNPQSVKRPEPSARPRPQEERPGQAASAGQKAQAGENKSAGGAKLVMLAVAGVLIVAAVAYMLFAG